MRRFVAFGPALVVLLATAVAVFAVPAMVRRIGAAQTAVQIELARQTIDQDDILERISRATRAIADNVEPSVVHIEVISPTDEGRRVSSNGSGWVYDTTGNIITNAHVVRNALTLQIQFYDGRVADAQVIGADPFTDIAVIRPADVGEVFPARRATGERPQRGDRVYSFGSPFGFKFSMSEGIVSALGRSPNSGADFGGFTNFIQTDAAVNPGNSGGPLVDSKGRVIGMNVAIANARTTRGEENEGQSAGISFAIPLATIESIAEQLIKTGEVSRGYLGLRFAPAPHRVGPAGRFSGVGLLVEQVTPGGPADLAGIKETDIVVSVAGEPVDETLRLRSITSSHQPGDKLTLHVWRGEAFIDVDVTLGRMPFHVLTGVSPSRFLQEVLATVATDSAGAVRLRYVDEEGPAYEAGLRVGDEVSRVAGRSISTVEGFAESLIDEGMLAGSAVKITVKGATPAEDRQVVLSISPVRE
ncbi:MAG: trypsin-like peptidase domain-containing protein [Phycisphaerales bacterium]|nr:trypsin-like peptidase domain-containing protein [Phycisphaerales bacterium]